ncbi:MAG: AAA family ATPase [Pseudobdellovibrio sp.]
MELEKLLTTLESDFAELFSGNTSYPYSYPDKGKNGGKIFPETFEDFKRIAELILPSKRQYIILVNGNSMFTTLRDEMYFYTRLLASGEVAQPTRAQNERGQRLCSIVSNLYLNEKSPLYLGDSLPVSPIDMEHQISRKTYSYVKNILKIEPYDLAEIIKSGRSQIVTLIAGSLNAASKTDEKIDITRKSENIIAKFEDFFVYNFDEKIFQSNEVAGGNSSQTNSDKFFPRNILLIGPPGTGKTKASQLFVNKILHEEDMSYSSKEIQKQLLLNRDTKFKSNKNIYSTQFHPSYTYEDFFEGLRPIKVYYENTIDIQYVVVSGLFKSACQIARCYSEKNYSLKLVSQFIKSENGEGFWIVNETSHLSHYRLNLRKGLIKYNGYPVQRTGKENFSEINTEKNPKKTGLYEIEWTPVGSLEGEIFVIFIDELNRGNPAKVFGEALSLIEDRKRLGRTESSEITLPYSHESFGVPSNISLVCAMNTADKSLSSIDNAFRRRFKTITLSPDFEFILTNEFKLQTENIFSETCLKSIINHFLVINKSLKDCKISNESMIGHSYALNILRDSFGAFKKNSVNNISISIEEIVKEKLSESWELELHSLIRDIVGEYRLAEFVEAFESNSKTLLKDNSYIAFDFESEVGFFNYIDNNQPAKENFPWKKAS